MLLFLWADIWINVVTTLNKIVLPNLQPVLEIGPWYAAIPDCDVTESIPINDMNWDLSSNLVISPTSAKNNAVENSPKPGIEFIILKFVD